MGLIAYPSTQYFEILKMEFFLNSIDLNTYVQGWSHPLI